MNDNMHIYDKDNIGYNDNYPALIAGQSIGDGSTVFLRCPNGYDVNGDNTFNICIDGDWLYPFAPCLSIYTKIAFPYSH